MCAQPSVESVSLVLAVDEVAMFEDAGYAKVVCAAANGQNQHVVLQLAGAGDHLAGGLHRREADASVCAVDGIELPGHVFEMMRMRMRHVLHLLLVNVPGPGRERVQHRLPDVDPAAVDQADSCQTATPKRMA